MFDEKLYEKKTTSNLDQIKMDAANTLLMAGHYYDHYEWFEPADVNMRISTIYRQGFATLKTSLEQTTLELETKLAQLQVNHPEFGALKQQICDNQEKIQLYKDVAMYLFVACDPDQDAKRVVPLNFYMPGQMTFPHEDDINRIKMWL